MAAKSKNQDINRPAAPESPGKDASPSGLETGPNFFRMLPLKLVIFLSAFLLFQIELILSKSLLPGFGGSYLVWGACMLFFQVALLAGYWASHEAAVRLPVKFHGLAQALLPLPALLLLLPADLSDLAPKYQLPFIVEIFRSLLFSIGAPFFVLSTVGVAGQRFLAASDLPESRNPYFLYGTSNLGSFAGLITYPFLVEPYFNLDLQFTIWKIALVALALLQAPVVTFLARRARAESSEDGGQTTDRMELAAWFLLSAAGSAMLLATTNLITLDLASAPLIWIVPLCLYLFTFYLNFKLRPWCPVWIKNRFPILLSVGIYIFLLAFLGYQSSPVTIISIYLVVLFLFCMFCHNELAISRPQSSRGLTAFYLALAAGGAGGTLLVALAAPLLTSSLIEYPFALLLATLATAVKGRDWKWRPRDLVGLAASVPTLAWPWAASLAPRVKQLTAGLCGLALVVVFGLLRSNRARFLALAAVTVSLFLVDRVQVDKKFIYHHRNFYGIYRVYDEGGKRELRHGAIIHGSQYLDAARSSIPLLYYHPTQPAGEMLSSRLFKFQDLGIVGLGAGSLAAYAGPGTRLQFYELDPDNLPVATKYFSFLRNSRAQIGYTFGDARLSLARNPNIRHDLLIIDAFNSDAIPVHLITVEAIQLYRQRLAPGGSVMFHISNRFLDLAPILRANGAQLGLHVLYKANIENVPPDASASEWMIMTDNSETAKTLVEKLNWTDLIANPGPRLAAPWTDNYSNIFSALVINLD